VFPSKRASFLNKEGAFHEKERAFRIKEPAFLEKKRAFLTEERAFLEKERAFRTKEPAFLERERALRTEEAAFLEKERGFREKESAFRTKEAAFLEKEGPSSPQEASISRNPARVRADRCAEADMETTRNAKITKDERYIGALRAHCAKRSIPVDGKMQRVEEIIAQFRDHLATIKAAQSAEARWRQLVKKERAKFAALKVTTGAVDSFVANFFGTGSDAYNAFGLKPRKTPKRSAENKAIAAQKLRATRKARGTLRRIVVDANGTDPKRKE